MAEFQYLTFYKNHPSERRHSTNSTPYENAASTRRPRGTSECPPPVLAPVMENEGQVSQKKQPKRRFSIDFLFSRKRKESRDSDIAGRHQRGSVDSTSSIDAKITDDTDGEISSASRRQSLKVDNAAELAAWSYT